LVSRECDYDLATGMKGIIYKVEELIEDGEYGGHHIYINLEPYHKYNKQFETPVYWDKNGNPTVKWQDSSFYPKNHCIDFYVDSNDRVKLLEGTK